MISRVTSSLTIVLSSLYSTRKIGYTNYCQTLQIFWLFKLPLRNFEIKELESNHNEYGWNLICNAHYLYFMDEADKSGITTNNEMFSFSDPLQATGGKRSSASTFLCTNRKLPGTCGNINNYDLMPASSNSLSFLHSECSLLLFIPPACLPTCLDFTF